MSFRIVEFICFFVHLVEKINRNKIGWSVKVEPKNYLICTASRVSLICVKLSDKMLLLLRLVELALS